LLFLDSGRAGYRQLAWNDAQIISMNFASTALGHRREI
jgi:hypothetical protein